MSYNVTAVGEARRVLADKPPHAHDDTPLASSLLLTHKRRVWALAANGVLGEAVNSLLCPLLTCDSEQHYAIRAHKCRLTWVASAEIPQITLASDNFKERKYLQKRGRAESCWSLVCALKRIPGLKPKPTFFCFVLLPNSHNLNLEMPILVIPFLHCLLPYSHCFA